MHSHCKPVSHATQRMKSLASHRRGRASKCLLRRQTESQRDPVHPRVAMVALRPFPPPAKRRAAGPPRTQSRATYLSSVQSGKASASHRRGRASKCLLRRQTESQRDPVHPQVAMVALRPFPPPAKRRAAGPPRTQSRATYLSSSWPGPAVCHSPGEFRPLAPRLKKIKNLAKDGEPGREL